MYINLIIIQIIMDNFILKILVVIQFIKVIGIDRCVGFFNIGNNKYILDRERM